MRHWTRLAGLALVLAVPSLVQAEGWNIDTAHSSAAFSVRHMMVSTVRGEFDKVSGSVDLNEKDITQSKVEAVIDATTISTRNEGRDKHLKSADFLDTANFPTITFKSSKVEKGANGKLTVTGDLTLHGVTKSVVLEVEPLSSAIKDQRGNMRSGTSATTKINRKEFGVNFNAALDGGGVVVSDEVTINIDVELVKQAPAAK
jgi:polyisoprenoid-binding protein YceI